MVVDVPAPTPAAAQPQALPLDIVYEDADLVVIDKAAGMVVHPAAGHADGTLVNALLHHVDDLSGVGGELRPGIVHRLDKGTSGLMVVAKHDAAHEALSSQFEERARREGIHGARLGRALARAPHRGADRPRSEQPAEDVDQGAAGPHRGVADHVGGAVSRRLPGRRRRSPPAARTRSACT